MFSRLSLVFFMKSTKEVRDHYKTFEALVLNQTGQTIKRVRSDNGKEYLNKELQEYAGKQGTLFEQTAPYSSSQNGVAERLNRTLLDIARSSLAQQELPKYLWQEAVAYANYLLNRIPTRVTKQMPFKMFYGRDAPLS